MRALRGLVALGIVVSIAQSCSNDFDKFEVGAGGSGAAASPRGGNTSVAGTNAQGGNVIGVAGDSSVAGTGAVSAAGAPGAAGAGGAACEQVDTDVLNCGECDRACNADGVAALDCSGGVCVSSCAPGFANCSQPDMGDDDGCETDVSDDPDQCGGCDNACPFSFQCASGQCICDNDDDCGNGGGVNCVTGRCECDNTLCQPGEQCRAQGGDRFCSCNDSDDPGCAANEFCCEAGCTDVVSSAANCGACGRSCTTGFTCVASACECDSDDDCGGEPTGAAGAPGFAGAPGGGGMSSDGGATASSGAGGESAAGGASAAGGTAGEPAASGGTGGDGPLTNVACVAGRCVCSGNSCGEGQRCLPTGSCG